MELGFSVRIGSRFRQSLLPALPLARRRGKIDNGAHVASPGAATQGREQLMKLDGDWLSAGLCLAAGLSMTSFALAADKVSFGTNWLAEAEHGGYYQAVVDGTYAKYRLDVTIVPGGPQANNGLLLAAGKLDFYMGGNLLLSFDAVAQSIPASASINGATCPERPHS